MRFLIPLVCIVIVACDSNNRDDGINPEEPMRLLWELAYTYTGFGPHMSPELLNDTLIVMSGDKNLTCVNTTDGQVKWRTKISERTSSSMRSLLHDDTQVYGWQVNDGVFVIDITTGQKIWTLDINVWYRFHSISSDHYYVSGGSKYYRLTKNGVLDGEVSVTHTGFSTMYYNGKVYSGQGWWDEVMIKDVGSITSFDAETGDSLWSYSTTKGGFYQVPPVFQDGILYLGTVYGKPNSVVVALNAETGEEIWTAPYRSYAVLLVENVLYVCETYKVHALDAQNGTTLWTAELFFSTDESPTIAYWDGYIYTTHYGSLYVLDLETGDELLKMRGPDNSPVYQVSAGAGKIFVQSSRHLYAYTPYDPGEDGD